MSKSALTIVHEELYTLNGQTLQLSVLGGIRLNGLERLRTTLKVAKRDEEIKSFRFSVDLYNNDELTDYIKKLSDHFSVSETSVSKDLQQLTEELENYRLSKYNSSLIPEQNTYPLSEAERKEAENYLKKKDLLSRTIKDIEKSGLVGEKVNGLIMYLVFTSRKMTSPLHILSRGKSGLGKTYLLEKIGDLIPEEDKIEITQLTANSLYYFNEDELQDKLILIEDIDGAEAALYPLRELQSKRRITKLSVSKDKQGSIKAERRIVKGKVSIAAATTKSKIYQDNQNRSIVIDIDDSEKQTELILSYQRKQSAGLIDRKVQQKVKLLFNNIQRVLDPMVVINPMAESVQLPFKVNNPRRTNQLYLSFIEAITFYHQYQREVTMRDGQMVILSTKEDIEMANTLLKEVLISKTDELTPAARRFYQELKEYLNEEKEFRSKEIRENLQMHPSKLRRYLKELTDAGYIETEGNKSEGYFYRLTEI